MCEMEKNIEIRFVNRLFQDEQKRFAVIKNKGGWFESVPEKSLPIEGTEIIYQLKP